MAFGLAAFPDDGSGDGPCLVCSPVHAGVFAGATLGLIGGALGSLAGAVFPQEKWTRVDAAAAVSAAPATSGGVALQARLRF